MSTVNTDDICANCGKGEESSGSLKACTACKMVKYCNRECQIAHRPQHKKECRKRAAELHEEKLFRKPPPMEDCPICFQQLPLLGTGRMYKACCGKIICSGCIYAVKNRDKDLGLCPFCRTPCHTSDEEMLKRMHKRVEIGDTEAINMMGTYYANELFGFPQDYNKALEFYQRAIKLGSVTAYTNIGQIYEYGQGVEIDKKKAIYYYELGAMEGEAMARHFLGLNEIKQCCFDRALKHWMIAIEGGDTRSLYAIKQMYYCAGITKDVYEKALRARQAYLDEIKSNQRDRAAANGGDAYKYIEERRLDISMS